MLTDRNDFPSLTIPLDGRGRLLLTNREIIDQVWFRDTDKNLKKKNTKTLRSYWSAATRQDIFTLFLLIKFVHAGPTIRLSLR